MVKSTSPVSPGATAENHKIPALVSIHDVMPSTLANVARIIDTLVRCNISTATLLIVPGKPWTAAQLDLLRQFSQQGFELAGHGWFHQVESFGGLAHRLHGLLISKKVAEHLALDALGISQLVAKCYQWFEEHDLPAPSLYVPPAWAMGGISKSTLTQLPFRHYEFFTGIYDSTRSRLHRMPLVGYEADARYRALFVAMWNRMNFSRALRPHGRCLRFSIHPHDFELYLQKQLSRDLKKIAPVSLW